MYGGFAPILLQICRDLREKIKKNTCITLLGVEFVLQVMKVTFALLNCAGKVEGPKLFNEVSV